MIFGSLESKATESNKISDLMSSALKVCRKYVNMPLLNTDVYISPKIDIYARTLKMALHKNPVMHCDRVEIFLHGSQKMAFSLHN